MKMYSFLFLSSLFFLDTAFSTNKTNKIEFKDKYSRKNTKNIESKHISLQCFRKKKSFLKKGFEDVFVGKKHGCKIFYKDSTGKLELNLSHKALALHGLIGFTSATQAYALYDIFNRMKSKIAKYKYDKEAGEIEVGDRLDEAYRNIKNLDHYHFVVESIASLLSGRITIPLFKKILGMNVFEKMRIFKQNFFGRKSGLV
jgi:hypothetical protein